jgi:hypothetical protein
VRGRDEIQGPLLCLQGVKMGSCFVCNSQYHFFYQCVFSSKFGSCGEIVRWPWGLGHWGGRLLCSGPVCVGPNSIWPGSLASK